MRGKDRHAPQGDSAEKGSRKPVAGLRKEIPELFASALRNTGQRRFDATPDPSGTTSTRVSVIVSRPIPLREGAPPIRRVLIFDDHPATLRLLKDVARAQKRENNLALMEFAAVMVLLLLAMFWRLL